MKAIFKMLLTAKNKLARSARQMKLSASPKFRDAIIAAQEHFAQPGLTELEGKEKCQVTIIELVTSSVLAIHEHR
jgi:hypothetical protein